MVGSDVESLDRRERRGGWVSLPRPSVERIRRVPRSMLRLSALLAIGVVLACDARSPTDPLSGLRCGPYPSQASSPYVLPYPPGEGYTVNQGYCTRGTHVLGTRDQYAYDFGMPIGSTVVAARSGVVEEIEERFEDGNGVTEESNYLLVRHDDGTAGVYFHLTHEGVLVELGVPVAQGQAIARSGQTGRAGIRPHLHFGVIGSRGLTIPVTFRNTIEHPNGLEQGQTYPAF
jgi:murein DD-endopeptidase MepM/ murein hydrolase activator NlpD